MSLHTEQKTYFKVFNGSAHISGSYMILDSNKPLGQAYTHLSVELWYFSRKPIASPAWLNIVRPFETLAWIALISSTCVVSITFVIIYSVYSRIHLTLLKKRDVKLYQLMLEPPLYLVEPENIKWFSTKLSAGLLVTRKFSLF